MLHDCEQDSTLVKNEAKRAFLGAEKKSSINRIMSAYTVSQFSYAVSRAHGIFSCGRVMQESLWLEIKDLMLKDQYCCFQ